MRKLLFIILFFAFIFLSFGINSKKKPFFNKDKVTIQGDWLVDPVKAKAMLYQTKDGKLVFSNGIVARTFTLEPNGATVGLDHLVNNEAFLRSVRPEAEVTINGIVLKVEGLTGQPIYNYLSKKWISELKTDPLAIKLTDYRIEDIRERFPWKKRLEWMPKDLSWLSPGKELIFSYKMDDQAVNLLASNVFTDDNRPVLFEDDFSTLPRKQQEIIERQNVYDGAWFKTPSIGWMQVPLTQCHGGGTAAIYEPLKDHLPGYAQRLANLFGAGVQAAWRGKELYDTGETKVLVKKWVDFYKSHRQILDAEIIHVHRPDGRDYDAILHADPEGEVKGSLMIYNPMGEPVKENKSESVLYRIEK